MSGSTLFNIVMFGACFIAVWFCFNICGLMNVKERIQVCGKVKAGQKYVLKLKKHSEAISEETISKKISGMEQLISQILEKAQQNSDAIDIIERVVDYYLPTVVELLKAYEKLVRQPVQEQNIRHAKKEMESVLDALNAALERILDNLSRKPEMKMAEEICILNRMLEHDGLLKKDLAAEQKKE